MGWSRNVAINIVISGKVSKGNTWWTADLIFMFLLNDIQSRTHRKLTHDALSRLPEYCVHQNDVLILF
jgi:hypothetical protein